jgi:hypothetical protein
VFTSTLGGKKTYNVKKGSSAYSINGSKPGSQFSKDSGVVGPRKDSTQKVSDAVIVKDDVTGEHYISWGGTGSGTGRAYWIKAGTEYNAGVIQRALKSKDGWKPTHDYNVYKKKYAKGTLGTTRDEWALTDESWIGEEITLAAGKNGQLQYLKKGSAVMPADISANLVEWGKLNPNMMSASSGADGINLMSNYINKPEIKVDVENFLNVGTVSKDTLPELEKLMDKKIDTFAKQLNASIRKFK